jgi:dolichol-phosphate mannosyltransferase
MPIVTQMEEPQSLPSDASQSSPRTLITVATYNERENLPRLLESVFAQVPHAEVLVIDDQSPDGTGAWCEEAARANPQLHCLRRPGKLGLGSAVLEGLKYAVAHDFDLAVNMDADFSHHPRFLPAILAAARSADAVIGSRYVAGGGTENWPLFRRLMSRCVNWYARALLSLPARDCSSGYRCIRVDFLKGVDLTLVESRGYAFFEEFLWRLKQGGARIREVPILFADREKGQSKINWREAAVALWVIFRLGLRNWLGI